MSNISTLVNVNRFLGIPWLVTQPFDLAIVSAAERILGGRVIGYQICGFFVLVMSGMEGVEVFFFRCGARKRRESARFRSPFFGESARLVGAGRRRGRACGWDAVGVELVGVGRRWRSSDERCDRRWRVGATESAARGVGSRSGLVCTSTDVLRRRADTALREGGRLAHVYEMRRNGDGGGDRGVPCGLDLFSTR
jgi:hypothetical protein